MVKQYIDEKFKDSERLDQVFHSKENLGKVNAILAAVKGNLEPLVTITDSDVLFQHDWQLEVEKTFADFPNAGMVSPVPGSKALKNFTANNWYCGIVGNGSIRFQAVKDPSALKRFDASLGNANPMYSEAHLKDYLLLSQKGKKAVMGCGHFVATLRREVFDQGSNTPAFIKIVGGVENKFIDIPNEDLGFLRLATLGNYAFHMGNVFEDWMLDEFDLLKNRKANVSQKDLSLFLAQPLHGWQTNLGKLCRKIFLSKRIKNRYFRAIGLQNPNDYTF